MTVGAVNAVRRSPSRQQTMSRHLLIRCHVKNSHSVPLLFARESFQPFQLSMVEALILGAILSVLAVIKESLFSIIAL